MSLLISASTPGLLIKPSPRYELLTGEWPWKEQPPEAIIWQVRVIIATTVIILIPFRSGRGFGRPWPTFRLAGRSRTSSSSAGSSTPGMTMMTFHPAHLTLLHPRDRPDFPSIAQTLERLPKKRLARSSLAQRVLFGSIFALVFQFSNILFVFSFFFPHAIVRQALIQTVFPAPEIGDQQQKLKGLHSTTTLQVTFAPHTLVKKCRGALLDPHLLLSPSQEQVISSSQSRTTKKHFVPLAPVSQPYREHPV